MYKKLYQSYIIFDKTLNSTLTSGRKIESFRFSILSHTCTWIQCITHMVMRRPTYK